MSEIEFKYNFESYQRENGIVSDFGEIYLQVNKFSFPEEQWTDFGCGVIYTWSEEVIKLLTNSALRVECNFYDGAFLFYIEKIQSSIWEITFVDEDSDKKFEYKCLVDPIQTSTNLLEAVKFMREIRVKQFNYESVKKYDERESILTEAIKTIRLEI